MELIVSLDDVRATDAGSMGAKAANLGELRARGFDVPVGFVVTADAHRCARHDVVPASLASAVMTAYAVLGRRFGEMDPRVAVRSSVVGEDAPGVSSAGVYRSVTNVRGARRIADAIGWCWASLHSERASAYRAMRGIADVPAMAVVVQAMVPAVRGGVAFSVDPTGRDEGMVVVEASFGYAASVVSGLVEPDSYLVSRKTGHLIAVRLGTKATEIVPSPEGEITLSVEPVRRRSRALGRAQATEVACVALDVERHMGIPQDVEWCYDANDRLFVLQARPILAPEHRRSAVSTSGAVLTIGAGASSGSAAGRARVLSTPEEAGQLETGEVLVVASSSPDWVGVLDRVAAVVTDRGGLTCHLAVASREAGIPCVVAARTATVDLRTGDLVVVDGTEGIVRSAPLTANAPAARRPR